MAASEEDPGRLVSQPHWPVPLPASMLHDSSPEPTRRDSSVPSLDSHAHNHAFDNNNNHNHNHNPSVRRSKPGRFRRWLNTVVDKKRRRGSEERSDAGSESRAHAAGAFAEWSASSPMSRLSTDTSPSSAVAMLTAAMTPGSASDAAAAAGTPSRSSDAGKVTRTHVVRDRGTLFITDRNLFIRLHRREALIIPLASIRRVVPCRIQVKTLGVANMSDSGLRIEGCEVGGGALFVYFVRFVLLLFLFGVWLRIVAFVSVLKHVYRTFLDACAPPLLLHAGAACGV